MFELLADEFYAGNEVEESDHLVPVAHGIDNASDEQVNLGRGHPSVAEAFGHRGYSPQLAERLEHDELALGDALGLNLVVHDAVVIAPALFVEVSLLVRHLTVKCLLGEVGQFLEHVALESSEDEGIDFPSERRHHAFIALVLYGKGVFAVEFLERAKHGGVEEPEERIEFGEVVLDRCSAECEPVLPLQQRDGLCGLCRHILDVLALVENDVVELLLEQLLDVVSYEGVRGEYELAFQCFLQVSLIAVIDAEGELWGELLQFFLPIEEERPWHDDERGLLHFGVDACEHGDGLQCLSQTHVIGQASSEFVLVDIVNPLDAFLLVVTQYGMDLIETHLLLSDVVEALIDCPVALEHFPFEALLHQFLDVGQVEE